MRYRFYTFDLDSLPAIRAWGRQLMTERRDEALETLRQEGLSFEAMYVPLEHPGYLLALSEGEHRPSDPTKDINREHYEFLKLLKPAEDCPVRGRLETIYELRA